MPGSVMVLLLNTCYSPCSYSLTVEKSESLGGLMHSQKLAGKCCSRAVVEFKCSPQFLALRGGLIILSSKVRLSCTFEKQ